MRKIFNQFTRLFNFFSSVGEELKKSSWPSRAELLDSTGVVIVSVVALALLVFISDLVLSQLIKLLI